MFRNIYVFVCAFFVAGCICSQTIPNAGFEQWHTVGGWFDNPDDWGTNNNSILAQSVIRDSGAYKGVLAMKVVNFTNLAGHAYIKFPLNNHPYGINVFVKSNIQGSDSAVIYVRAYYKGNQVDSNAWFVGVSLKNWTAVNIPLYNKSLAIDSFAIDVKAGNKPGTWLSVDEFSIDFGTGMEQHRDNINWNLFPNPITESGYLSFENPGNKIFTLVLYDQLGRVVHSITNITAHFVEIRKGNLKSGLYMFGLSVGNDLLLHGKLIVVE